MEDYESTNTHIVGNGSMPLQTDVAFFQHYYNLICNIKRQLEIADVNKDGNVARSKIYDIIKVYQNSYANIVELTQKMEQ